MVHLKTMNTFIARVRAYRFRSNFVACWYSRLLQKSVKRKITVYT